MQLSMADTQGAMSLLPLSLVAADMADQAAFLTYAMKGGRGGAMRLSSADTQGAMSLLPLSLVAADMADQAAFLTLCVRER